MKAGFSNISINSGHKNRGIGVYSRYLIEALKKQDNIKIEFFDNLNLLKDVDVVHYPYFDFFKTTLPIFEKKFPTVVTIHDVTPLLFPKHYPPGIKGTINSLIQRFALLNVSAVITDSENSKKDIAKTLGVNLDKIFVTYLAPAGHYKKISDREFLNRIIQKYNLPEKFVLYTGNVNWNKNILNTTAAAIKAGVDIVLVGKSFEQTENLNHPELKSLNMFNNQFKDHPKIHVLGFVDDQELVGITNLAKAVLLVSYYEGFGLPILEAQVCGVPVITSPNSSLTEVGGESVLYADPKNTDDIAAAITKIFEDENKRVQLIKKGYQNLNRFSWEKCARETIEVYEKILR